jgi:hypothetical protein
LKLKSGGGVGNHVVHTSSSVPLRQKKSLGRSACQSNTGPVYFLVVSEVTPVRVRASFNSQQRVLPREIDVTDLPSPSLHFWRPNAEQPVAHRLFDSTALFLRRFAPQPTQIFTSTAILLTVMRHFSRMRSSTPSSYFEWYTVSPVFI